jgi:hypothetical protein
MRPPPSVGHRAEYKADVVGRRGEAVASADGAGLMRDERSGRQIAFEAFRARDGFGHQLQQQRLVLP